MGDSAGVLFVPSVFPYRVPFPVALWRLIAGGLKRRNEVRCPRPVRGEIGGQGSERPHSVWEVLDMFTSEGYAHAGLRNVLGGLPRAPLVDSLCPGLTSGCAFGARKGSCPTRGSMGRTSSFIGPGCRRQVIAGYPGKGSRGKDRWKWRGWTVRQRVGNRGHRVDERVRFHFA